MAQTGLVFCGHPHLKSGQQVRSSISHVVTESLDGSRTFYCFPVTCWCYGRCPASSGRMPSCPGGPVGSGWYSCSWSCPEIWCVAQYRIKAVDQIPRDRTLHKATWTRSLKTHHPSPGPLSACQSWTTQEEHCPRPTGGPASGHGCACIWPNSTKQTSWGRTESPTSTSCCSNDCSAPCSSPTVRTGPSELAASSLATSSVYRWEQVHTELVRRTRQDLEASWRALPAWQHCRAWQIWRGICYGVGRNLTGWTRRPSRASGWNSDCCKVPGWDSRAHSSSPRRSNWSTILIDAG